MRRLITLLLFVVLLLWSSTGGATGCKESTNSFTKSIVLQFARHDESVSWLNDRESRLITLQEVVSATYNELSALSCDAPYFRQISNAAVVVQDDVDKGNKQRFQKSFLIFSIEAGCYNCTENLPLFDLPAPPLVPFVENTTMSPSTISTIEQSIPGSSNQTNGPTDDCECPTTAPGGDPLSSPELTIQDFLSLLNQNLAGESQSDADFSITATNLMEFQEVTCSAAVRSFTSFVYMDVDLVNSKEAASPEEIQALETSFIETYDRLSLGLCDPYFRRVVEAKLELVMADIDDGMTSTGGVQEAASATGQEAAKAIFTIQAECRDCPVSSTGFFPLFGVESGIQGRRMLETTKSPLSSFLSSNAGIGYLPRHLQKASETATCVCPLQQQSATLASIYSADSNVAETSNPSLDASNTSDTTSDSATDVDMSMNGNQKPASSELSQGDFLASYKMELEQLKQQGTVETVQSANGLEERHKVECGTDLQDFTSRVYADLGVDASRITDKVKQEMEKAFMDTYNQLSFQACDGFFRVVFEVGLVITDEFKPANAQRRLSTNERVSYDVNSTVPINRPYFEVIGTCRNCIVSADRFALFDDGFRRRSLKANFLASRGRRTQEEALDACVCPQGKEPGEVPLTTDEFLVEFNENVIKGEEIDTGNSSVTPAVVPVIVFEEVLRDMDGDGLSDLGENNKFGTDPSNPDTDGDGLSDGQEVNDYESDPLNPDDPADGSRPPSSTSAPTMMESPPPEDLLYFTWYFGFEKGRDRAPTEQEVMDLICQTNLFFQSILRTYTDDNTTQVEAINIDWSYNAELVQPVSVSFAADARKNDCKENVHMATVYDGMQLTIPEIKDYIRFYVWDTPSPLDRVTTEGSMFNFVVSANFKIEDITPIPIGQLAKQTCSAQTCPPREAPSTASIPSAAPTTSKATPLAPSVPVAPSIATAPQPTGSGFGPTSSGTTSDAPTVPPQPTISSMPTTSAAPTNSPTVSSGPTITSVPTSVAEGLEAGGGAGGPVTRQVIKAKYYVSNEEDITNPARVGSEGLYGAWPVFVAEAVANITNTRNKNRNLLRGAGSRRRLVVGLEPDSESIDIIEEVDCPEESIDGATCHNVTSSYVLLLRGDEDPAAVEKEFGGGTINAVDDGSYQAVLDRLEPESPITIGIISQPKSDSGMPLWLLILIILLCVLCCCCILFAIFYLMQKDNKDKGLEPYDDEGFVYDFLIPPNEKPLTEADDDNEDDAETKMADSSEEGKDGSEEDAEQADRGLGGAVPPPEESTALVKLDRDDDTDDYADDDDVEGNNTAEEETWEDEKELDDDTDDDSDDDLETPLLLNAPHEEVDAWADTSGDVGDDDMDDGEGEDWEDEEQRSIETDSLEDDDDDNGVGQGGEEEGWEDEGNDEELINEHENNTLNLEHAENTNRLAHLVGSAANQSAREEEEEERWEDEGISTEYDEEGNWWESGGDDGRASTEAGESGWETDTGDELTRTFEKEGTEHSIEGRRVGRNAQIREREGEEDTKEEDPIDHYPGMPSLDLPDPKTFLEDGGGESVEDYEGWDD